MELQRCNHCMCVFDEQEKECPECGNDDALMYPFTPNPADHVWNKENCMACDMLIGMRAGMTTAGMEKIIIDALAKAGIDATISTVEVIQGKMR